MNRMRYLNVLQKLAKPATKPRPDGILRTVTAGKTAVHESKESAEPAQCAEAAPMFDSWGFRQMGGRRVAGARHLNLRTGQRSPIHAVLTAFRGLGKPILRTGQKEGKGMKQSTREAIREVVGVKSGGGMLSVIRRYTISTLLSSSHTFCCVGLPEDTTGFGHW